LTESLQYFLRSIRGEIRLDKFAWTRHRRQEIRQADVIMVVSNPTSPSNPYRIDNPTEGFLKLGLQTIQIDTAELERVNFHLPKLKFLWLYRPSFNFNLVEAIQDRASNRLRVITDHDDLTFDEDAYNPSLIPGLRALPSSVLQRVLSEIPCQRRLIEGSSVVSTSTKYLSTRIAKLNAKTVIIPNHLSSDLTKVAQSLTVKSRGEHPVNGFRLVYASGTPTHQEDFLTCWEGVVEFLESFEEADLTIIGHMPLERSSIPREIRNQVHHQKGLLRQTDLILALSQFDLNLAPLDTNLDFNHAKSALKVIHAGAAGVRSLGSDTEELALTINRLSAGQIVNSKTGWFKALAHERDIHLEGAFSRTDLQRLTIEEFGFQSFLRIFSDAIRGLEAA
jgi:hypothetical protein